LPLIQQAFSGEQVFKGAVAGDHNHPLVDPKQARALIAALPAYDYLKALDEITGWLESLVSADGFRLDRLFELTDLLDSAATNHHKRLVREYLGTSRQQKFQEVKLWTRGFDFASALSNVYLSCVTRYQNRASGASVLKKHIAVVTARALRALGLQLKWTMLRYGPFDPKLWTAVGELYRSAESSDIADIHLPIYSGAQGSGTIREEYLKILMLCSSGADVLPPLKQELAERVVAYFAPLFEVASTAFPGALYCFDAAGARPPTRVKGDDTLVNHPNYFGPGDAPVKIAKLIAVIARTGIVPASLNFGPHCSVDTVVGLLRHLAAYWTDTAPPRVFPGRATTARINVVPGYMALLDELERDEVNALNFTESNTESWVVENVSDNGYGALVPASHTDWIRVGEIIGVQVEGGKQWGVGLVRRVARDEQRQVRVEIDIISPRVVEVRISQPGGCGSESAILLSGTPDANGEIGLVMRAGRFDPNTNIEVNGRTKSYVFVPCRLIDSGDDFDWAMFKIDRSAA
jgi:hypothetical protein